MSAAIQSKYLQTTKENEMLNAKTVMIQEIVSHFEKYPRCTVFRVVHYTQESAGLTVGLINSTTDLHACIEKSGQNIFVLITRKGM